MGLLELASNNSLRRGLDYCESGNVKKVTKIDGETYEAIVSGSTNYHIILNVNHPRKSSCNCPHAAGKRIICKHMVAVYLYLNPDKYQQLKKEIDYEIELEEERNREIEDYLDKRRKEIHKHVYSLTIEELRSELEGNLMYEVYEEIENDENELWRYY